MSKKKVKQPTVYVNGEKQEKGVITKRSTREERLKIAELLRARNPV